MCVFVCLFCCAYHCAFGFVSCVLRPAFSRRWSLHRRLQQFSHSQEDTRFECRLARFATSQLQSRFFVASESHVLCHMGFQKKTQSDPTGDRLCGFRGEGFLVVHERHVGLVQHEALLQGRCCFWIFDGPCYHIDVLVPQVIVFVVFGVCLDSAPIVCFFVYLLSMWYNGLLK